MSNSDRNDQSEHQSFDEQLLHRLIDGEADSDDWTAWLQMTEADETLANRLKALERDHQLVQDVVERAGASAQRVSLPPVSGTADKHTGSMRIGVWSGWTVAALVTISALVWNYVTFNRLQEPGLSELVEVQPASATEAFENYLRLGRKEGSVVDEVPTRILIDAREAPDGDGYDVLYLRQVLERVRVPDLYMLDDVSASGSNVTQASYVQDGGPM